jgi:hypothetical protein
LFGLCDVLLKGFMHFRQLLSFNFELGYSLSQKLILLFKLVFVH